MLIAFLFSCFAFFCLHGSQRLGKPSVALYLFGFAKVIFCCYFIQSYRLEITFDWHPAFTTVKFETIEPNDRFNNNSRHFDSFRGLKRMAFKSTM